jgi:hypothetical protein
MRGLAFTVAVILGAFGLAACTPAKFTGYPTPAKVGTPAGWVAKTTHNGDLNVTRAGTVLQDIRVNGSVNIKANNVVIRRARIVGRVWTQWPGSVRLNQYSVTVEDSVLGDPSGRLDVVTEHGTIGPGKYTIRRSEVYGSDGFRVSKPQDGSKNNVLIEHNFFRATTPSCNQGLHLDGVQGYFGGQNVTINHNTIVVKSTCGVTGAIFFADNSESATVYNNLLVAGGYVLRIQDDHNPDRGPWIVMKNRIVSTGYGPVASPGTQCSAKSMSWADNRMVTIDTSFNIKSVGRAVSCAG